MSSPIVPTQSSTGAGPALPGAPDDPKPLAAREASATGWVSQLESALSQQQPADGPPAEVLDRMAQAARTYERLSAQGRELRFVHDEASGSTVVEVHDGDGNVLKQLSLAEACDIADGAPLD